MRSHIRGPRTLTAGLLGAALAAAPPAALAVGTDDYTTHPRLEDAAADPTIADVGSIGTTYITAGSSGVRFTTYGYAGPPYQRGHVALDATALAIAGDHCVWIATTDGMLHRIDFTDPDNPVVDMTVSPGAGMVSGLVYSPAAGKLVGYTTTFGIFEVTVPVDCGPGTPVVQVVVPTTGARAIAGDGMHVVAGIGSNVLNLDTSTSPTSIVNSVGLPASVNDLAVSGDLVAVLTAGNTLEIIERNLLSGIWNGPAPTGSRVRFAGSHLLVTDPAKRMIHAYDVSDPANTMRTASLSTRDMPVVMDKPAYVEADTLHVSFATPQNIRFASLGDRTSPQVLDQENPFIPNAAWWSPDFYTLAVAGQSTVDLYDTSDPTNPQPVGSYDPGTSLAAQDVEGYEVEGRARALSRYLLVGSLADFRVLDVTDPSNPALAGSIASASPCVAVAPDGGRAARSDVLRNVHLVDLSDPANPADRGSLQLASAVEDLVLDGSWLVAASTGETGRWDVTDPDAPALGHTVPLTGIRGVAKSATPDHFYFASDGTGGRIVRYDFGSQAELSSATVPAQHLSVHTSPAASFGGATELVYASSFGGSVYVIDWSDPAQPVYVGEYTNPDFQPRGITASGEAVVVADTRFPGRVLVLPAHEAADDGTAAPWVARPESHVEAWPNPFTRSTAIGYSLERADEVRVDVFDAAGRRVRTLWSGSRVAGPHRVTWDGRAADGGPVAAGVYFVRVATSGTATNAKILRVR